jgi:hypothetical protein
VDKAELTIEEVVIENPLLTGSAHELGAAGSRYECEAGASFLGAKDGNESLRDAVIADQILGPLVLAELASAIHVNTAGLLRSVAGMSNQSVGVLWSNIFHEI